MAPVAGADWGHHWPRSPGRCKLKEMKERRQGCRRAQRIGPVLRLGGMIFEVLGGSGLTSFFIDTGDG